MIHADDARNIPLADELELQARKLNLQARNLLLKANRLRRIEMHKDERRQICQCKHRRFEHGPAHSINYTGGYCSICECKNFQQVPEATAWAIARRKKEGGDETYGNGNTDR